MHAAEKEYKKMKKLSETKKEIDVKGEILPDWFNKNIEANSASDEERQAIEDMLKEYR